MSKSNVGNSGERLAVTIPEAARMVSVSSRSIQNYIRAKLLPSRKIGRRRVVLVRHLEAFLRGDQPSPLGKGDADVR